ncbi:MAG: S8 family serine peptidase [Bdellovibrionales bacterium]|nr:S8 family serine peptidase [Bdellovibrionales bacterium]
MKFTTQKHKPHIKIICLITLALLFAQSATSAEAPANWSTEQIDLAAGWRITRGNKKIVVAVIDTGIDRIHPELKENLWSNPLEIENGIDDDGNGLIDDIHGWNFTSQNADITDNHGHGTHIAGIIKTLAPDVSLMILKYYDPGTKSKDNLINTVKAIDYAVKMNANIINYSGGGKSRNSEEEAAIKRAEAKGIIFVAAAGNEKSNSDITGFYPAAYDLPNIISVTATDQEVQILKSSNYGQATVDIAAPGKDIYSTIPGGHHGKMTGTSQATAFVTGAAALVLSKYQSPPRYSDIINAILTTTDAQPQLLGKVRTQSQLNIYRSLAIEGSGVSAFGQTSNTNSPHTHESYIYSN